MTVFCREVKTGINMDFLSDLAQAIVLDFTEQGIFFPHHADVADLASRYLEMQIRRIEPVPRRVHFSEEIHYSLGNLVRSEDSTHSSKALEAWTTVFYLRHLFEIGGSVLPYLTERVNHTEKPDGLLWDYAMHHMHLSRDAGKSGFVERSDWLLFAIVADQDAYFVDVRPHTDPDRLQWVRQDLLTIVHDNWPELTASRVLHGVTGNAVTDIEKQELRRKNTNLVHDVGGYAIAPLGWGTTADGHSTLCRFLSDKLLHELEQQQRLLDGQSNALYAEFLEKGMRSDVRPNFGLTRRKDLKVTEDQVVKLCSPEGFSRALWHIGFAIIETNTRSLVCFSHDKGKTLCCYTGQE